jgi:hypothetical protein
VIRKLGQVLSNQRWNQNEPTEACKPQLNPASKAKIQIMKKNEFHEPVEACKPQLSPALGTYAKLVINE